MALDDELGKIIGGIPIWNLDQLHTWLDTLPHQTNILCLAIIESEGERIVKFARLCSPEVGVEMAKTYLEAERPKNPMLDALRGLLPPGHPLKD